MRELLRRIFEPEDLTIRKADVAELLQWLRAGSISAEELDQTGLPVISEALHHASWRPDFRELAVAMINAGVDPNAGEGAALRAVAGEDLEVTGLLLAAGADPNLGEGAALAYAADAGDVEAVRLLLDHGADPLIENQLGFTAMNPNGRVIENEEIRALLRERAVPQLAEAKGSSLRLMRRKKMHDLPAATGMAAILEAAYESDASVRLTMIQADSQRAADALAASSGGRVEENAHRRLIQDTGVACAAVVSFRGKPWTLVAYSGDWKQRPENGKVISADAGLRVVSYEDRRVGLFEGGRELERHAWDEEGIDEQMQAEGYDPEQEDEYEDRFRERCRRGLVELNDWMASHGIFVPAECYLASTGFHLSLVVSGLRKRDVTDLRFVLS